MLLPPTTTAAAACEELKVGVTRAKGRKDKKKASLRPSGSDASKILSHKDVSGHDEDGGGGVEGRPHVRGPSISAAAGVDRYLILWGAELWA